MTQTAMYKNLTDVGSEFSGTLVRAVLTLSDFIVSCSDCATPSVNFYDLDLDLIHTIPMQKSVYSAYELTAYDLDLVSLQTYIAGGDEIRIL